MRLVDSLQNCVHHLLPLDIREGTDKFMFRAAMVSQDCVTARLQCADLLIKTIHGAPKQKICRNIQSHPVE